LSKCVDRIVGNDVVEKKFGFVLQYRSLSFGEGDGGRGYKEHWFVGEKGSKED
jgi:hypothetical protein